MPFANIIGVRPHRLAGVIHYLGDTAHPDHIEYGLTEIKLQGVDSIPKFAAVALKGYNAASNRLQRGRPPVNCCTWSVIRMPDQTLLTPAECVVFEDTACDEASNGIFPVTLYNWHHNILTGASDLNVLTPNFTPDGTLLRDRIIHPVRQLRRRMDAVTELLNIKRLKENQPIILTMEQVQRERRLQRGEIDIIPAMASLTKPPQTVADLEGAMLLIGCELCSIDLENDFIFFRKPKQKKPKKMRFSHLMQLLRKEIARMKEDQILIIPTGEFK